MLPSTSLNVGKLVSWSWMYLLYSFKIKVHVPWQSFQNTGVILVNLRTENWKFEKPVVFLGLFNPSFQPCCFPRGKHIYSQGDNSIPRPSSGSGSRVPDLSRLSQLPLSSLCRPAPRHRHCSKERAAIRKGSWAVPWVLCCDSTIT